MFAIVFPEGKLGEWKEAHTTAVGVKCYDEALESLLPDIDESVREEMVRQLSVGTPTNGGLCVWVSSLGSPENGVVLVGDSAHGMWPSLGQGANCALESAAVFCKALDDLSDSVGSPTWSANVVREFNDKRYDDAVAAVDLTYGGIGARKSRGRNNSPLSYKLQVAGIMILHKVTFGLVPMPALLRVMKGESVPYSTARRFNFYYEKIICVGALAICVLIPLLYMKYH